MTHKEFPLSADPASVREARGYTRSALSEVGCTDSASVALVVSELVTNAIVHAREPISLHLWPARNRVRVGVSDASAAQPTPQEPSVGQPHGRGLAMIERLSLRWGFEPHPRGKLIWAEVNCR
jgi:anti-sigma regulatory factor (Ser/Thr protein kinase)